MKNVLAVLLVGLAVAGGIMFRNAGISADEVKNGSTGKIEVVVQDTSDKVISSATVQVQSQDTNKTTKLTNKKEIWSASLAAGRYTVQSMAPSYKSSTLYTIIKNGETQTLTVHLEAVR